MNPTSDDAPAVPEALSSRPSTLFAILGTAGVGIGLSGALRSLSAITFVAIGLATVTAFAVGIWRNRPPVRSGWIIIGVALLLFVAGGAAREGLHTLGNLTSTRSLLPDLITLPGYALLGAGATAMASSGRNRRRPDFDVILDSAIAALAVLVLDQVFLIAPALAHAHVPLRVRVLLAVYPATSAFLVATAARVAFRGRAHRIRAHQYLAVGLLLLLGGDLFYTLTDSLLVSLHEPLLDLPYGLAFVAAGSAALHPSMARRAAPVAAAGPRPVRVRLGFVAAALGLPAGVAAFGPIMRGADQTAVSVLTLVLTACAIWRVMRALAANARAEDRLVHQATHDLLTGLPNRRVAKAFASECLARATADGRVVALLFLDVDRFKMVNDTFGHSVGDELLLAVARRLQGGIAESDLVARLGGDEFVVVVDDLEGPDDALEVARRILGVLRAPFTVTGIEIFSTASVGVACGGPDWAPIDAETLIRNADLAMYQAKAAGRDGIAVFSEEVHGQVAERLRIERDLRHALERQELVVNYQPIVSLDDGSVRGFEALLRWHHPVDGPISPEIFIPIAEETGLITQIGSWVLDQACQAMAGWRRDLPGAALLTVAVNVSARQFRAAGLLDSVGSALRDHRLPASALRIELTESMLIGTSESSFKILTDLRRMGIGLSIDDFGTGYSSLAYLQRYPVDCVKIDRSFVTPLAEDDTADESLVAAIIAMCGALGMKTIAEGIEVESQRRKLVDLGCDLGQGWLFAKAMGADEVSWMLGEGSGSALSHIAAVGANPA